MKNVIKQNVGIDVSKKELAVCFMVLYDDLSKKIKGSRKFSNNEIGFKLIIDFHVIN